MHVLSLHTCTPKAVLTYCKKLPSLWRRRRAVSAIRYVFAALGREDVCDAALRATIPASKVRAAAQEVFDLLVAAGWRREKLQVARYADLLSFALQKSREQRVAKAQEAARALLAGRFRNVTSLLGPDRDERPFAELRARSRKN